MSWIYRLFRTGNLEEVIQMKNEILLKEIKKLMKESNVSKERWNDFITDMEGNKDTAQLIIDIIKEVAKP